MYPFLDRKLPNTRLRCDADVARLKAEAELEVVMRGVSSRRQSGSGGKAGSTFTAQPILY